MMMLGRTAAREKWFQISIFALLLGFFWGCRFVEGTEDVADNEEIPPPPTVSIVLLGRKGSGITSTVRQILGSRTSIHGAEEAVASTDILEYTLRIPVENNAEKKTRFNYLRLIDVPGLELGENLEHDAEILSNLKSYLHEKGVPTFLLVVYRVDDRKIGEPNSQFAQLLRSVEYFQQSLFHTSTDNTLFLLTRVLSEPPEVQLSPQGRIEEFREVIMKHTSLPQDVEILVGDNKPDPEKVPMDKGFVKLPNNELYPKNVLDKILTVSGRSVVTQGELGDAVKNIVNYLVDTRETANLHTKELVPHPTDEEVFENDLEAFEYLLRQESIQVPENQIQNLLQSKFERQDVSTQISSCVQLRALQVSLRNLNLERIQQLPQSLKDLVHFFQEDADGVLTSKYSMFYLFQALQLEVPEYPSENLIVGNGYDLINDRVLRKSVFLKNSNKRPSTSLGYQFPDFIECEKLADMEEVALVNTTNSLKEYHDERLKLLSMPDKENVVVDQLRGDTRPFLNLQYEDSGRLSVLKEIRILECKMTVENDSIAIIDDGFVALVNSLPPLNTSCGASVSEWKLLLQSYGTHVITKTFGGGCYQGQLSIQGQGKVEKENVEGTLNDILEFKNLNINEGTMKRSLVYQFHQAGDIELRTSRIDELDEQERNLLLGIWKRNLHLKFEMLDNELELVPLSQIIGIVNATKQLDAENATKLLLQGKLESTETTSTSKRAELSVAERRKLIRDQSLILRQENRQKALQKLKRFNEFVDEASAKRD